MDRKLIDCLPPPLAALREFKVAMGAEDPEFDLLWAAYDSAYGSPFIETAGADGIARMERICGVVPDERDSLDTRRMRLLVLNNFATPLTYRWLLARLGDIYGTNFTAALDPGAYTLDIGIGLASKSLLRLAEDIIGWAVPANIAVNIHLLYNSWGTLKQTTWGGIGARTWIQAKEDPLP
jgi:hypothetical protein